MLKSFWYFSGIAAAALCCAAGAQAAQFVVVLRPGGSSWQVMDAEKVTFSGKDKVRYGSSKKLSFSADEYKKLASQQIARAGAIRRHADGYLTRKEAGGWEPIAPDGLSLKSSSSYSAAWSSATAIVQKDSNSKSAAPVKIADLFAVLPGPDRNAAVVAFLSDETNFKGVGLKDDDAFEERMSLLAAVAGAVSGDQSAKLQRLLWETMESANQELSAGIAHHSVLLNALKYADVSEKAYPNDDRQRKDRAAIREKKLWLDQRIAILRAFFAGELWDAFLDKYGEFERWDNSFEDLRKMRERAFKSSTDLHRAEGMRLYDAKQYATALKELKLAQQRSPNDPALAALVETVGIDEERSFSKIVKAEAVDLTSPRQVQITRYLYTAENFIRDNRLKEAEGQLGAAEALDASSTRIMLVRAKLYHAASDPLKALEILDQYARRVTTQDEINQGEALRTTIRYDLQTNKEKLKAAITKAEAEGDFVAAWGAAQKGLAIDPQDLDFLRHGGSAAAVTRKAAEAQKLLNQYLQRSQGPGSDAKARQEVYDLLALLKAPPPEPSGKPNWYSGYKAPAGVFYCPVSLAPNANPADIKGGRNLSVVYQWNKDALVSIRTSVQGANNVPEVSNVYFDYFKNQPAVRRVGRAEFDPKEDPGATRLTPSGAAGSGKGAYVALLNHPDVDPVLVGRMTGKPVATIVAGNPYFHPFVWTGIYTFLAEYDDQGRVKSATQIGGMEPEQKPHVFDFKWDGLRLTEIVERGGNYRRAMTYVAGKLMSETVSYGPRNSKIEYKYLRDQLVEASAGDDASVGGRSMRVTFR